MLSLRRSTGEGFAIGDALVLTLREVRRPHFVVLTLRRGLGPTEFRVAPVTNLEWVNLEIPGHPTAAVRVEIAGFSEARFHFEVPDGLQVMRLELLPFAPRHRKVGAA